MPQRDLHFSALLARTDSDELKKQPIPSRTARHYAAIPQSPDITRVIRHDSRFPEDLNYIQFAVGGRAYPSLARWVRVTERFRGQVLRYLLRQITGNPRSHYDLLTPEQRHELALISGKDRYSRPLQGHQHAFFLLWPDANGIPSRLIVWRHQPFTENEVNALMSASEHPVSWASGAPDWSARLVPLPFETRPPLSLIAESHVWRSATPFVPPSGRHRFRKNGRTRPTESPICVVAKLLQAEGKPTPEKVTLFEDQGETPWVNLHEPRQRRQLRAETYTPWIRPGYWLRIEFKEPVQGPLILGDSCHFGLGLFVPAKH